MPTGKPARKTTGKSTRKTPGKPARKPAPKTAKSVAGAASRPGTKMTVMGTGGTVATTAQVSARVVRTDTGVAVQEALVRFKIDGGDVGESTSKSNGVAAYSFSMGQTYSATKYSQSAKFDGNDFFKGSSDSGTFTVNRGNPRISLEGRTTAPPGTTLTATLLVQDAAGKAIANGNLKCTINGRVKYLKTDAAGRAAFTIAISPGANVVKVDYSQDSKFNSIHREFTITGK